MKTGVASRTATGWMTSIVPTPVPDAAAAPEPGEHATRSRRPPPTPPHSTSTSGSPVTMRASSTGSAPLSRSPATTTAAHLRPSARSALVPPVRPEPTVRGSAAARAAGDEDADRDRAGEVGDEHQDDRPEHDRGVHRARSSDAVGDRLASQRPDPTAGV